MAETTPAPSSRCTDSLSFTHLYLRPFSSLSLALPLPVSSHPFTNFQGLQISCAKREVSWVGGSLGGPQNFDAVRMTCGVAISASFSPNQTGVVRRFFSGFSFTRRSSSSSRGSSFSAFFLASRFVSELALSQSRSVRPRISTPYQHCTSLKTQVVLLVRASCFGQSVTLCRSPDCSPPSSRRIPFAVIG